MNKRESFIFYRSFYESIIELEEKDKLSIFNAICNYSLNLELPDLKGIPKSIFVLIKPQLDANNKRYKNGCQPKTKRKTSETEARDKQKISETEAKNKQKISETEANDNDNVNDNVNDNANENSFPKLEISTPPIDYNFFIQLFNKKFTKILPAVQRITKERKSKIKLRLKEFGDHPEKKFHEICEKIESSDFLKGDNETSWVVTFDWIFSNGQNWVKIIEGNYDNKKIKAKQDKHNRYDPESFTEEVKEKMRRGLWD